MVVHGHGNENWNAYSFENSDLGLDDLEDESRQNGGLGDENSDGEALDDQEFYHDPNGGQSGQIEANRPIWDARLYFLRVCDERTRLILHPAKYLVHWMELNINDLVCSALPSLSWKRTGWPQIAKS